MAPRKAADDGSTATIREDCAEADDTAAVAVSAPFGDEPLASLPSSGVSASSVDDDDSDADSVVDEDELSEGAVKSARTAFKCAANSSRAAAAHSAASTARRSRPTEPGWDDEKRRGKQTNDETNDDYRYEWTAYTYKLQRYGLIQR